MCKKIGGIDIRTGHAIDLDFTIRYASCSPFVIYPKPVAAYTRWKKAASSSPAGVHITNYDALIENVNRHFIGTFEEREEALRYVLLMKQGGLKYIWINSILKNQLENAAKAREAFFQNGGNIVGWKLKILFLTEKSWVLRTFFQLYMYLKSIT